MKEVRGVNAFESLNKARNTNLRGKLSTVTSLSYIVLSGNTKGGSITVLLTSCLTGSD
jgi:hypothetical protein